MKGDPGIREEHITNMEKSFASETGRAEMTRVFYCNLFSNMVTENLCLLRRRQLIGTSVFFCEECNRNINQPIRPPAIQSADTRERAAVHPAEPAKESSL